MEWFQIVAVVLGPGGAVYIGMRSALNGMKRDIKDVKTDVRDLRDWHLKDRRSSTGADVVGVLQRISTQLDRLEKRD